MNLASQVGNLKKWKNEKEKEKTKTKDDKKDGEKQFVNAKEWRKQRYDSAPEWMKKEPDDKSKPMKCGKSTWYWCTYHKLWQKHEVKDCRLNPANKNRVNDNPPQNAGGDNRPKANDKANDKDGEKNEVKYTPRSTVATSSTYDLNSDF
jgi:hypothetical protein